MTKLKDRYYSFELNKVILFSGHMIDKPGRKPARFPPELETAVSNEIENALDILDVGLNDLALCGGACGGDLIFAELCLKRGAHLEIRIPFSEQEFLDHSVNFAGEKWVELFYKVKENTNTKLFVMPDELGTLPENINPYIKNNLWQLETALAGSPKKVNFLCLWDKKTGDGPGGTKHMYDEVKKMGGKAHIIDITKIYKEGL